MFWYQYGFYGCNGADLLRFKIMIEILHAKNL